MQIVKPIRQGIFGVIMVIGIFALTVELIEFEAIAKIVVIPCLVLLISVTGYAIFQTYKL